MKGFLTISLRRCYDCGPHEAKSMFTTHSGLLRCLLDLACCNHDWLPLRRSGCSPSSQGERCRAYGPKSPQKQAYPQKSLLTRLPLSTLETIGNGPVHQLPDLTATSPHSICRTATFSYSWPMTHPRHTLDVVHQTPEIVLFSQFRATTKVLANLENITQAHRLHGSALSNIPAIAKSITQSTGMRDCYYREWRRHSQATLHKYLN